jgi:hypothetical protein
MGDLRVTDLQGILRKHADVGHDITQSPQHVHLDGKPYGMVVNHHLQLNHGSYAGDDASILNTYLTQAERPLVSKLQTMLRGSTAAGTSNRFRPERGVTPYGRHQFNSKELSDYGYDDLHYINGNHSTWVGDHGEWQNDKGLWVPHNFSKYKDSHEALQSHTSAEVPHDGVVYSEEYNSREMTPEEHSAFNNTEALHNLTGLKPFSGLVNVLHVPKDSPKSSYTYNPQTEELHRHE